MPTISVIMGIYNTKSREYLEKSIKSILNQTYSDFEFIICDDGSTNDCLKWAKEICGNDKRVVFLENDSNKGLSFTLNKCLEISKGEYIARMDDDDESRIDRFEKQIKYLKNENVDLISSNINCFDDDGIYNTIIYPEKITNNDFLFNNPIVHPAMMAKKKVFDVAGMYKDTKITTRVEDYELVMRMCSKGVKIGVVQDTLLNYRDDRANTKRRKKYKYRINEARIRYRGFKSLGLLPRGILFVFKPLLLGLLPISVMTLIKKRKRR